MHLAQRGLPREIPPPRDRDAPIDRGGERQQHKRPPAPETRQETRVEALGLRSEEALFDRDPGGAEPANALPVGARIGVAHRDDHARDAGLAHRVDARRGAALVRARLEIGVERRAARAVARFAERVDFGVGLAGRVVITLADHRAVPDHDGADERIGARPPGGASGEPKCAAHVGRVRIGHGC